MTELPFPYNALCRALRDVDSADADAPLRIEAAATIERLTRLFHQAVVDMKECACEWEPDPHNPGEHTDKIRVLCGAHEELFEQEMSALQRALAFWLPGVPAVDAEIAQRAGDDAVLLAGYDCDDEPSAEERGWISLRHVP